MNKVWLYEAFMVAPTLPSALPREKATCADMKCRELPNACASSAPAEVLQH